MWSDLPNYLENGVIKSDLMPDPKRKILFIYLEPTSFVSADILNLKSRYELVTYHFGGKSASGIFSLFGEWFRQFIWLIRESRSSDLVMGWFIDYHMLLPVFMSRRLGKRTVIFEGGFGCLNIPEFRHGVFFSRWRKYIARYVVRSVSFLIPVTEKLVDSENTYTIWPEKKRFGLKQELPDFNTPYRVIPTGYDPDKWPMGSTDRPRRIATVGIINSMRTFKIKGIDLFIEVSKLMPDTEFIIVGVEKKFQKVIKNEYELPPNLVMYAPVGRSELKEIYMNSSVYMQLSRVEGFPNVMCEAMLCGCIPVGSPVFGIPDIVDNAGYIVESPEPEHIAEITKEALSESPESRARARDRIKNNFSSKKRYEMLTGIIEKLAES